MRTASAIVATIIVLVVSLAAQNQAKEKAAAEAAAPWLALVDSGNYAQSWQEAASIFKAAVTQEQWERTMKAERAPLGSLLSRKLVSARYTTRLPGAPDGEYVVLQFDSSFSHKKSAVETATPMMDGGQWRVSGYYMK